MCDKSNIRLQKTNIFDTFSANSLKILDKSTDEFRLRYIKNLYFTPDNKKAKTGQNLHNFLCFYLKNFDTSKIEGSFSEDDKNFIEKIKDFDEIKLLKDADKKSIEQPFLIKCTPENTIEPKNLDVTDNFYKKENLLPDKHQTKNVFYLTGRFDAALIKENSVEIYDWKTLNTPKDPENDIQTIVYLYAASKLYKTKNISIKYISLTKNESVEIPYTSNFNYFKRIFGIVQKLYL